MLRSSPPPILHAMRRVANRRCSRALKGGYTTVLKQKRRQNKTRFLLCQSHRKMMIHICCHQDASCLDQGVRCFGCDGDGYPTAARRRLTRQDDGTFLDINDGQVFRVKKAKADGRLVPTFDNPVKYKGSEGFAAMRLILSCLGPDGEYVLWDETAEKKMDVEEWKRRKYKSRQNMFVKHMRCDTSASSSLANLRQGWGVACFCSGNMSFDDSCYYEKMIDPVACGRIEWYTAFHRKHAPLTPPSKEAFCAAVAAVREGEDRSQAGLECYCARCDTSASASLNNLRKGQGVECFCSGNMSLDDSCYYEKMIDPVVCGRIGWYTAFHRKHAPLTPPSKEAFCAAVAAVREGEKRNQAGLECYCARCDTSASAMLNSLRQGNGVACKCRHKTEAKLVEWLQKRLLEASITPQYRGPKTACGGQTHFDVHLAFPDSFKVLVELDGPQHFWVHNVYYTDEGRDRDVVKEEWAISHDLCVVRVLQEDVWDDCLDWQGWLIWSINAARTGVPRPITPGAPEYRSSESAYVQARKK